MKKREIIIDGDIAYVPLTKGYVAIIDSDDAHIASGKNWYAKITTSTVYAKTTAYIDGNRKDLHLHREIMKPAENLEVDHKDGDGLNNRKINLRIATHQQNMHNMRKNKNNTSGYKGVVFCKRSNLWIAKLKKDRKTFNVGYFKSPEVASEERNKAALMLHGEFARGQ